MNIERRGSRTLILALAAVVAFVALAALAWRQVARIQDRGTLDTWVASAGLVPGQTVGPADLRRARIRGTDGEGVIRNRQQIQGRQLTRRKQDGEPFTADDFASAPATIPALSESIPEGRVLFPLRVTPHLFHSARLRRGDRIDLVAATRSGEALLVARDAFLMGQSRSDRRPATDSERRTGPFGIDLGGTERPVEIPLFMYLAVHPEDALPLSEAQAAGASLRLVMHAKSDVAAGRVTDIASDRDQLVELISGADRSEVPVAY